MKFVVFTFTVLALTAAGNAETMTEHLLRAQGELSLTHEFIESQFIAHRDLINPILEDIQKFSIDLYLDSIDAIKLVAADTREQMSQFGLSPCANASRAQWERRTIAHVNTLNFCASEATRIFNGEYSDLTYFDKDGSRVSNHVQNQGLNIMSQTDIFESNGDYYSLINRRLRNLLLRAGPWIAIMDELLELMDHHTAEARFGVTMCTRIYTMMFNGIAAEALEGIKSCASDS